MERNLAQQDIQTCNGNESLYKDDLCDSAKSVHVLTKDSKKNDHES